ncbi:hypothetical protein C8J57DRAFT_1538158 [Mycena rebaudengoi]|nr:hypothetical protein C8J57DRAFT_1538158 [Mycena rebaudengoi]
MREGRGCRGRAEEGRAHAHRHLHPLPLLPGRSPRQRRRSPPPPLTSCGASPSTTTTNTELPRCTPGTLALSRLRPPPPTSSSRRAHPGLSRSLRRLRRQPPPPLTSRGTRDVRLGTTACLAAHHHTSCGATPGTSASVPPSVPPLTTTMNVYLGPAARPAAHHHHHYLHYLPWRIAALHVRLAAATRFGAHHHHRRRRPARCPLPANCASGRPNFRVSPPPPPPPPSTMPSPRQLRQWAAKLQGLLHAPASRPDPRGYTYVFATTVRLNRRCRRALKFGRTVNLQHRRVQWARSCPGQRQRWLYAYRVPHARQFEAIIQLHLKIHGAWLGRVPCEHCPKAHIEKFCWAACGGPQGLRDIIEHYLRLLNWPIRRVRIRAYI